MHDLAALIETSPRYTVHVWHEDRREIEYVTAALACLKRNLNRPSKNVGGFAIPNEKVGYTADGVVLRFLARAELDFRMNSAYEPIEAIIQNIIAPACQDIIRQIDAHSPKPTTRLVTAPLQIPQGIVSAAAEDEHFAVRFIRTFDVLRNRESAYLDVVFGF